jgi:hypothetical protein
LSGLEAVYPALLPTVPCTRDAHLHRPPPASAAQAAPPCAASHCAAWLPGPEPSDAAVAAFLANRSFIRVAARDDDDARRFGHMVALQRPSTLRKPLGVTKWGPRVAPSTTTAAMSMSSETSGVWVEVTRTFYPGEGTHDYGCWLHPAVGSGVFVRLLPSTTLSWRNRAVAHAAVVAWSHHVPGGRNCDGDLPRLAASRGWSAIEILESHRQPVGSPAYEPASAHFLTLHLPST